MTWKKIMKSNSKRRQEFADEVIRHANRILENYTKEYDIDDVPDLELELRDVLEKIFADLV